MFRILSIRLIAAVVFVIPCVAGAREYVVDYKGAIDLGRERAPAVLASRARIQEAVGHRAGAAIRFPGNPEIDVQAGPRLSSGSTGTDFEIGVGQSFELGGRRGARIAGADAGIAREQAAADDTLRLVLHDVALAYYRALVAGERLRFIQSVESVAGEILNVAEKRLAKGDLVLLDVNLARSAVARARSAVRAAQADREAALGELRALLALDRGDTLDVKGDLTVRRAYDLERLLSGAQQRPDLIGLGAEQNAARAEIRLGEGYRWPDARLGVSYTHEPDADIILGGVAFTLPVFDRGQEHQQVGRAQVTRIEGERQGLGRTVDAQVRSAFAVYQDRVAAVDEYERNVIPLLDENDRLLRRSFEAGQIGLANYLVARRELLDARSEYLDRLFEMAEASVDLETEAGVLR